METRAYLNRQNDQQGGIFPPYKPFFHRNTGHIARKNGAVQGKRYNSSSQRCASHSSSAMRSTCSFSCFILHLPIVFVKSIQLLLSDFQRYAYDRNLDGHFIIDIRTKADSIDWVRIELYIRQQETGYPVQASSY